MPTAVGLTTLYYCVDYKNPIIKMYCRCLDIRDLVKVLKLSYSDSTIEQITISDWFQTPPGFFPLVPKPPPSYPIAPLRRCLCPDCTLRRYPCFSIVEI